MDPLIQWVKVQATALMHGSDLPYLVTELSSVLRPEKEGILSGDGKSANTAVLWLYILVLLYEEVASKELAKK